MSITVAGPLAELALIDKCYSIKDAAEVFSFLAANPFLMPILLEARKKLEVFFPRSAIGLELHSDPEGKGEAKLAGYISPDLFPLEDAFARLTEFRQIWWLEAKKSAQFKLTFILEQR